MDEDGMLLPYIMLKLPNGFQKRLALDISDGAAHLDNRDPLLSWIFRPVEPLLNLIRNMRYYLNRAPAVVSVSLLI